MLYRHALHSFTAALVYKQVFEKRTKRRQIKPQTPSSAGKLGSLKGAPRNWDMEDSEGAS
jgi:hypothetical protein